jgi:hypothetical protein
MEQIIVGCGGQYGILEDVTKSSYEVEADRRKKEKQVGELKRKNIFQRLPWIIALVVFYVCIFIPVHVFMCLVSKTFRRKVMLDLNKFYENQIKNKNKKQVTVRDN